MRVGIPVFQNRVAPRLDCAAQMLILEIEGEDIFAKKEISLCWHNPLVAVNQIKEMAVDVLICGAVPCFMARLLAWSGVRLVSWVSGDWEEVLKLFIKGELNEHHLWPCPGKQRKRRRRGK